MLFLLCLLSVMGKISLLSFVSGITDSCEIHNKLIINIYLYLKLPTILSVLFLGFGLGLSGCVMQGLIQNPLADPSILGVSSGASFFALLAVILCSWFLRAYFSVNLLMLIGSIIGAILVMGVLIIFSRIIQNGRVVGVLLAGVALSAMFGALTIFMMSFMSMIHLKTSIAWMFGSISSISWTGFLVILGGFIAGLAFLAPLHSKLDALMLGYQDAELVGINLFRTLLIAILGISIIIASSVAIVGPIGFVGLISPHIARGLTDSKHKMLMVNSALVSGCIMLFSELLSKNLYPPYILPLSAITAIMGGPFFLWLLWKFYGNSKQIT